ncbi:hypothetical protein QYF36_016264 [Acer negundo]|nr:hypothetical protein QYF36_016264 [Acer negundo]
MGGGEAWHRHRASHFAMATFTLKRPTLHGQGQNQHAACPQHGTSARGVLMLRHQRAWHAHAKAPLCLVCHTKAPTRCAQAKAPIRCGVPMPRNQRVRHALAKAPRCGRDRGGTPWDHSIVGSTGRT